MSKIALIIAIVVGFSDSQAEDYMGFYPPETFGDAFAEASHSVYKIWIPSGSLATFYLNESVEKLKLIKEQVEKMDDPLSLVSSQLSFCIDYNVDPCLIHDDIARGTAFLMESGSKVWTANHVIRTFVDNLIKVLKLKYPEANGEEILAHVKAYPLPMRLFDRDGNMIKLSKEKHIASIVLLENMGFPFNESNLPYLKNDLVSIQLSEEIGKPLALAANPVEVGEKMYLMGYPILTMGARMQDFNKPDSNGKDLVVSAGVALGLDKSLTRLSAMNSRVRDFHKVVQDNPAIYEEWSEALYFTEVDVIYGNSGGPVLNEKAEVVAVVSSFNLEYRGKEPSRTHAITVKLNSGIPIF